MANRLAGREEGHEVRLSIQNAEEQEIGDGFVPKAKDWRQELDSSQPLREA